MPAAVAISPWPRFCPKFRREGVDVAARLRAGRRVSRPRAGPEGEPEVRAGPEGEPEVMLQLRIRERWPGLTTAVLAAAVLIVSATVARARRSSCWSTASRLPSSTSCSAPSSANERPKPPARQEVIDTLIDEILEIREAKNYSIEVPDTEVENSYSGIAKHLGIDTQKLNEMLSKAVRARHSQAQAAAQLAWDALIRGRYKASLQIADSRYRSPVAIASYPGKGQRRLRIHDAADLSSCGRLTIRIEGASAS